MRRGLLSAAAAGPVLALAGLASAACPASGDSTASVHGDITVPSGCTVAPKANAAGLTLNSNNSVTVAAGGSVANKDVNNTIGILVEGGVTGNLTNSGTISLDMSYTPVTEPNGVVGGAFATGTDRIGIDVEGAAPLNGSITNATGAAITVQGKDSEGILVNAGLTGSLIDDGKISVTGNADTAIEVNGAIAGNLTTGDAISATGVGSRGLVTTAAIGGQLAIGSTVTSTAYRLTTLPAYTTLQKLGSGQLQQGGAAVSIGGDVAHGVTVAPAFSTTSGNTTTTTAAGVVTVFGGAPALVIGAAGAPITIGNNAAQSFGNLTDTTYENYGLYIGGDVEASGVYSKVNTPALPAPVSSTALELGVGGGGSVDLSGGLYVTGLVSSTAADATATSILFNSGTTAAGINNVGSITSTVSSNGKVAQTVEGIVIEPGASVQSITNSGLISSTIVLNKQIQGLSGSSYAIVDDSGTVTSITNSGAIDALVTPSNVNFAVNPITQSIDVSHSTTGVAITQNPSTSYGTEPAAQFTGVFDKGTLTVKSLAPNSGNLVVGETLYGAGVPAGAKITAEGTGKGGTGTYTVSTSVSVAAENVLAAGPIPHITGDIIFGGGANSLTINSGNFTGAVTQASPSGTLALSVAEPVGSSAIVDITAPVSRNGVSTAEGHTLTSLAVGSGGELLAATDPTFAIGGAQPTALFNLAPTGGTASFANGAQIGLTLDRIQSVPQATYVFVQTDGAPGALSVGNLNEKTLVNAPFLYTASTTVVTNGSGYAQDLDVTLTLKTPQQLGLNQAGASAFPGVFGSLENNTGIGDAIIGATNNYQFLQLYNQLLPNQMIGTFESIETATQKIANLTEQTPDKGTRIPGSSLWLQEINSTIKRNDGATLGETDQMFGLVGGAEKASPSGGAIGVTLAYLNIGGVNVDEPITGHVISNLAEVGAYYRQAWGGLRFSVRAGGGYGWFNEKRPFVTASTSELAYGSWGGFFGDAHAGLAYEAHLGRFVITPQLSADYLYLNQSSYNEFGGGPGFDMSLGQRTSERMTAAALVSFGAQYGKDTWFRPEIYGGYRAVAFGNIANTVAVFQGGDPFSLAPGDANGGWLVVGFSLKAGTPLSYVAIEGEADLSQAEQRYDVYLSGRALF